MKLKLLLITLLILFITNTKTFALDYVNGKFERIYSEEEVKKDPSKMNKGRMVVIKEVGRYSYKNYLYENGELHEAIMGAEWEYDIYRDAKVTCKNVDGGMFSCKYIPNGEEDKAYFFKVPARGEDDWFLYSANSKDYILIVFANQKFGCKKQYFWAINKHTKHLTEIEGKIASGEAYMKIIPLAENQFLLAECEMSGKLNLDGLGSALYEMAGKMKYPFKLMIIDTKTKTLETLKDWKYLKKEYITGYWRMFSYYVLPDGRILINNDSDSRYDNVFELYTPKGLKE